MAFDRLFQAKDKNGKKNEERPRPETGQRPMGLELGAADGRLVAISVCPWMLFAEFKWNTIAALTAGVLPAQSHLYWKFWQLKHLQWRKCLPHYSQVWQKLAIKLSCSHRRDTMEVHMLWLRKLLVCLWTRNLHKTSKHDILLSVIVHLKAEKPAILAFHFCLAFAPPLCDFCLFLHWAANSVSEFVVLCKGFQ